MKQRFQDQIKEELNGARTKKDTYLWKLLYQINIKKSSYDVYNLSYLMRKLKFSSIKKNNSNYLLSH